MSDATQLTDITRTIQLAVAPVFLLSAVGTTLSVMTTRLGRVVDRARRVETELKRADARDDGRERLLTELRMLERRSRLIYWALTACTVAALLVCSLIATAFLGYLFNANFGVPVAIIFTLAVGAFMAGLSFFLREVFYAIATLRFDLSKPELDVVRPEEVPAQALIPPLPPKPTASVTVPEVPGSAGRPGSPGSPKA